MRRTHAPFTAAPVDARERTPRPGTEAGGAPLPGPLRAQFEPLFGADFSQVRVHADGASAARSDALQADAYTQGQVLHFGPGRWQPETRRGRELIAHELAHTLQQRGGGSAGPAPAAPLEAEADHAAARVTQGQAAHVAPARGAPWVQRKPRQYNAKFDEGHWTVNQELPKWQDIMVRWRTEVSGVINAHCGHTDAWPDYRFVIVVAQRLCEQGGSGPRESASHNNLYNVMGPGDQDVTNEPVRGPDPNSDAHRTQYWKADNREFDPKQGKKVNKPAYFAAYSSESVSHDRLLSTLEKTWPPAYKAIAGGGSVKDYVDGIYPDRSANPHGNFATETYDNYLIGMRLQARWLVGDLRHVYEAYLKEYQAKVAANPPATPAPAVAGDAEINQYVVELLKQELRDLDDLTDRLASDQPVNRPAAAAAP